MNAIFVNDCSGYHVGSALVMREFRRLCSEAGIQLMGDTGTAGLMLVNGEGTLHHEAPRAKQILRQMEEAAPAMPVVLLNTVWQKMSAKLHHLSLAVARESTSAEALWREAECGQVRVLPDISLCCPYRPPRPARRKGLLFVDSLNEYSHKWAAKAAEERGCAFIEMCQWKDSPEALIDLMAQYDGVVSGRFHGVTLAWLAGTPVIALPGNTHKTEAMMRDFGLDESYCNSRERLEVVLKKGMFGGIDPAVPELIECRWRSLLQELPVLSIKPERPVSPVDPEAVCVLVGNGPSTIGMGLGRLIDACDEVVRFNDYAVEGFEADVGTRTTLWSTFGQGTLPLSGEVAKRAIFIHGNGGDLPLPMEEVHRIALPFYDMLWRELRQVSRHCNAENISPTSGFLVTRWLLECGVRRLYLAGIDHFAKHSSPRHHYWDERPSGRPFDHDGDAEALLLKPYVEMGRVRYLSGGPLYGAGVPLASKRKKPDRQA